MGNKLIHLSGIQLNLQFHFFADDRWGGGYDRNATIADIGASLLAGVSRPITVVQIPVNLSSHLAQLLPQ
jgi:hypothetical protein